MLVKNKNNLTKDINKYIIEIYQQTNAIKDTRKNEEDNVRNRKKSIENSR